MTTMFHGEHFQSLLGTDIVNSTAWHYNVTRSSPFVCSITYNQQKNFFL
jgi:hypothetical protein